MQKNCSKCSILKPEQDFVKKTNVCKSCRKIHMQKYYEKNKEEIKSTQLKYYNSNKEKIKCYYLENKNDINKKSSEYYKTNKQKISKRKRQYEKKRLKEDSLYKLSYNIRRNISISIKGRGYTKKSKTTDILGCSFQQFKEHIEKQFKPWMNWSNKGKYNGQLDFGWDLDHIIPLQTAKNEEDIIRLNHYTNFQPLCSKLNRDILKGRIKPLSS